MRIAIYGAASNEIDDKYKNAVYELCRKLGKRGHSLIFGAGDGGLMGAAARGFKSADAQIIGVAPAFFMEDTIEALYEKSDFTIYTDSMGTRKNVIEFNADGFVVLPGGIGTLDEFFQVITLKQLKQINKPIVLFNAYDFYTPLDTLLQNAMNERFLRYDTQTLCKCFTEKQMDKIIEYLEAPIETDAEPVTSVYGPKEN